MLNKKALSATAGVAAEPVYVEDVFSTYLYNGTGADQTITNDIDLSGEGGLVWIKPRNKIDDNQLYDTNRGLFGSTAYDLNTNNTDAQTYNSTYGLNAFNSNGFGITGSADQINSSTGIYASWTFRKASKFFDVVTYTGTGSTLTVNHSLGSTPGFVVIKRTDTTGSWVCYHRSLGFNEVGFLNATNAFGGGSAISAATSTTITVPSGDSDTNANGGTYVAYLFAHDAGGFGDAGDQSVIKCGSYTGDNTGNGAVTLGWEPQWLMVKRTDSTAGWYIIDNMRGFTADGVDTHIQANLASGEAASGSGVLSPIATGFKLGTSSAGGFNTTGGTYIYIAIRRGPMKTPTDATKVFTPTVYTGTNVDNRLINTTIAPDFVMIRQRNDTVVPGMYTGARLTGPEFLITGSTNAGTSDADSFDAQIVSTTEYGNAFSSMSGVWVGNDATRKFNANTTSNNHVIEAFKRAPGFFDVVCYTGNATAGATVSHNLGVAPELLIVKSRGAAATNWNVYAAPVGNTKYLLLNSSAAEATGTNYWNSTTPTSTVFTLGNSAATNASGGTFLALLFASCPGVSKVGSYTGSSSNVTVDCGFTAGARFVLIKCTSTAGNWWLFDTARGIVAGNDPRLYLNTTDAEDSSVDYIDSDNTGFIVNSGTQVNANGETFIYLAIA